MTIVDKKLSEIHPYEKNPRMNDKAANKVAESIKAYGFKIPMVVTANGEIVCGHTRYKAAKILGLETVPCVIADDLTPEQIKAFRIADNKVSDASIWDNKLLLEELNDLPDDMFTGFLDGEVFNNLLDEKDNAAVDNNEFGVNYEAVFRSADRSKIEKMQAYWETLDHEPEPKK